MSSWVALGVLAASAFDHARSPRRLFLAISQQNLAPARFHAPLAAATIVAEFAISAAGLLSLVLDSHRGLMLSLFAAAALYASYAIYTAVLVRGESSAPCGCGGEGYGITLWVPFRALILALAAGGAASFTDEIIQLSSTDIAEAVIAALAAISFGVVLWGLPRAMDEPVQQIGHP